VEVRKNYGGKYKDREVFFVGRKIDPEMRNVKRFSIEKGE